jgi:hypothetical protein
VAAFLKELAQWALATQSRRFEFRGQIEAFSPFPVGSGDEGATRWAY